MKTANCPLCGWYGKLTEHHTIWPRRKYHNHPKRHDLTIYICRECHDMVHDYYEHTRYRAPNAPVQELWQL